MLKVIKVSTVFQVMRDSFSYSDTLMATSSCSFSIIQDINNYTPIIKGEQIYIADYRDGKVQKVIFRGFVDESNIKILTGNNIQIDITCICQRYITNKRLVNETYENAKLFTVIRAIVQKYLRIEGIEPGYMGRTDEDYIDITFNFTQITDALDTLAEDNDCIWYITNDRKLNFHKRFLLVDYLNLFDLNARNLINDFQINQHDEDYRNKQVMTGCLGEKDRTVIQDTSEKGTISNIDVGYPIMQIPRIFEISGEGTRTEMSVGNKGIDEESGEYNYFWSYKEANITTSDGYVTEALSVEVQFKGGFPIVVNSQSQKVIDEQQRIDGTSGIIETVEEGNFVGVEKSQLLSNKLLLQKSKRGYSVQFSIYEENVDLIYRLANVKIGYCLRFNLQPLIGGTRNYLITKIDYVSIGDSYYMKINAETEVVSKDWSYFFKEKKRHESIITGQTNASGSGGGPSGGVIPSIPTETELYDFVKEWEQQDTPNVFGGDLYPSDTLFPSENLYPVSGDFKTLYIMRVIKSDVTELVLSGSYVDGAEDEINTTFYITEDVVGSIVRLDFYDDTNKVLLDSHEFIKEKNNHTIITVYHHSVKMW